MSTTPVPPPQPAPPQPATPHTSQPGQTEPPSQLAAYHRAYRTGKRSREEALQIKHDALDTEVANLHMRQICLLSENALLRLRNGYPQIGDPELIERGSIVLRLLQEGKPDVLVLRMLRDMDASKALLDASKALLDGSSARALPAEAPVVCSQKRVKKKPNPTREKAPVACTPTRVDAVEEATAVLALQAMAREGTAPPPPPPPPQNDAAVHEQKAATQDGPDFIPDEEFDAFDQEHWEHLEAAEDVTSLSYEPVGTPLITPLPTPFGTPRAPARVRPALIPQPDSQPSSPSKMARFLVMG